MPLLLACDNSGTVLRTSLKQRTNYLPYGSTRLLHSRIGYNGQLAETRNTYALGNGYRHYLCSIMRFTKTDSHSPFASGGTNPYAYVRDDPVNFFDPSGAISKSIGRILNEALPLKSISWTRNVRKIASEISVHDDIHKGYRRLNINAHGRPGLVKLDGEAADGNALYDRLIKSGIDFQDYRYIRVLSCSSAEAHPYRNIPPIPRILADRTNKPVKAFRGVVTVQNDVGNVDAAIASRAFRGNPAGGIDIQGEVYVVKYQPGSEYVSEWFYPESLYR